MASPAARSVRWRSSAAGRHALPAVTLVAALLALLELASRVPSPPTAQGPGGPGGSSWPPSGCPPENPLIDDGLEVRAREIVGMRLGLPPEELCIVNSEGVLYEELGVTDFAFTVQDRTGELHVVDVDKDGAERDEDVRDDEDLMAQRARVGRLDPGLADELETAPPEERIEVALWVESPPADDGPELPGRFEQLSEQDIHDRYAAIDAYLAGIVQPATAPVVAQLLALNAATAPEADPYVPVINAALTPAELALVAQWGNVEIVYSAAESYQPLLDVSRPAMRAKEVNDPPSSITGSGVKVAVVDVGAAVAPNHPLLNVSSQAWPTPTCLPSDHTAAVAGVVASRHATQRGIAADVTLMTAGVCAAPTPSRFARGLQQSANAVATRDAQVLNLSFGETPRRRDNKRPSGLAKFFDAVVERRRRSVVVASGDTSTDTTVTNPGRAYNVITVGGYNDLGTPSSSSGKVWPSSNAGNPAPKPRSNTDPGREKPEVLAPGVNIQTTMNSNPFLNPNSSTGTSFAAPHVTGLVALIMQRLSCLALLPEAIKAIVMVSARHNLDSDHRLSPNDGAGAVMANFADEVARHSALTPVPQPTPPGTNTRGDWGSERIRCNNAKNLDATTFSVNAGSNIRAVISWTQISTSRAYRNHPSANFDLQILDPSLHPVLDTDAKTELSSSRSRNGSFEIVQFTALTTGVHTLRIVKQKCSTAPVQVGWAWHVLPGLATPTATPTSPTAIPEDTGVPTNTAVPTVTESPTITPTPSDTPTPGPTLTPSATEYMTSTPTVPGSPSQTPTPTPTDTPTETATPTPTDTPQCGP